MVKFEEIMDGAAKYIETEIYPRMTDWQEVIARILIARVYDNKDNIKTIAINNVIVRTFNLMSDDGDVDIEKISEELKKEITKKNKITIKIPAFGTMSFNAADVDRLMKYVKGGA